MQSFKPSSYDPDRIKYIDLEKPDDRSEIICELPLNSFESKYIINSIKNAMFDTSIDVLKLWKLCRILKISNDSFEKDFIEKKREFYEKYSVEDYCKESVGFLTTIKEQMVYKMADTGLKIKLCPYNYLGYNIAGVHVSKYLDVALMEASDKLDYDEEVILIVYKYMLGRSKHVPLCEGKTLIAPTPRCDSHIPEDRIDYNDTYSDQYTKSLVYLYEFANANYEPVERPRHCCPVAAVTFQKIRPYKSSLAIQPSVPLPMNNRSNASMKTLSETFVSTGSTYPNDVELRSLDTTAQASRDFKRDFPKPKAKKADPWAAHVNAAQNKNRNEIETFNIPNDGSDDAWITHVTAAPPKPRNPRDNFNATDNMRPLEPSSTLRRNYGDNKSGDIYDDEDGDEGMFYGGGGSVGGGSAKFDRFGPSNTSSNRFGGAPNAPSNRYGGSNEPSNRFGGFNDSTNRFDGPSDPSNRFGGPSGSLNRFGGGGAPSSIRDRSPAVPKSDVKSRLYIQGPGLLQQTDNKSTRPMNDQQQQYPHPTRFVPGSNAKRQWYK